MSMKARRISAQAILGATIAATVSLVLAGCHTGTSSITQNQSSAADQHQSSGVGNTQNLDDVTIGLTYIPNVQFSPVYVADEQGFYSDEGLNVTIRHHGADEGLFTAVISGEEDVVIASGDESLVARAQGMNLVSIGAYYHTYPGTVIVPEESPIRELHDLQGKKIGIPGEYGSNWYATLAVLQEAGLTTNDVTIMSIGYTQTAALAGHQVDAVVGFTNNDLVQMELAGMKVRSIALDPENTPLVAASILTTDEWLQSNPDKALSVVDATVSGMQKVIDEPSIALDATKKWDETLSDNERFSTAQKVLDATIPLWKSRNGQASGLQDRELWSRMASFLSGVPGLVEKQPDAEAAVTNDYTTR